MGGTKAVQKKASKVSLFCFVAQWSEMQLVLQLDMLPCKVGAPIPAPIPIVSP